MLSTNEPLTAQSWIPILMKKRKREKDAETKVYMLSTKELFTAQSWIPFLMKKKEIELFTTQSSKEKKQGNILTLYV